MFFYLLGSWDKSSLFLSIFEKQIEALRRYGFHNKPRESDLVSYIVSYEMPENLGDAEKPLMLLTLAGI